MIFSLKQFSSCRPVGRPLTGGGHLLAFKRGLDLSVRRRALLSPSHAEYDDRARAGRGAYGVGPEKRAWHVRASPPVCPASPGPARRTCQQTAALLPNTPPAHTLHTQLERKDTSWILMGFFSALPHAIFLLYVTFHSRSLCMVS